MKIKLNDKVSMDLDELIETRLLIQSNSGGGKSYTIRRIIEQAFGHVQIIVLDPEGEFANLRSKFDFVYVGKDGDAPAESRSAALLARRLLELKASAIIDLYELPPQERKHFVRLFCESMVNAPKELWHDCLVVLDEAHIFAPEKSESEALGPVLDLASRGRKRGYSLVLASQRISKLHKDAAAECNNKLIGRTSLDIDRKRAGEELGLTSREEILALRNLVPGEFMVFGPAIGSEVQRIHIGDVIVKSPKRGITRTVPAPSSAVKKILGQLKDLPQEAQKEAQTVAELKARIRELERADARPKTDQKALDKAFNDGANSIVAKMNRQGKESMEKYNATITAFGKIQKIIEPFLKDGIVIYSGTTPSPMRENLGMAPFKPTKFEADQTHRVFEKSKEVKEHQEKELDSKMGAGERKTLAALAQYEEGLSREHITVLTTYKRSTRDKYIYLLTTKGYATVREGDGLVTITPEGKEAIGDNYERMLEGAELADYYVRTLPQGESKVLKFLLEQGIPVTREQITEATNFQRSTRDKYIYLLRVRQIVNLRGDLIKVSDHLL